MDDIFMVMEFMEHDLKGLMEGQETNGVFAMSEVSSQAFNCLSVVCAGSLTSHSRVLNTAVVMQLQW